MKATSSDTIIDAEVKTEEGKKEKVEPKIEEPQTDDKEKIKHPKTVADEKIEEFTIK